MMRTINLLFATVLLSCTAVQAETKLSDEVTPTPTQSETLRQQYEKPVSEWPKPTLAEGIEHRPLGILPPLPSSPEAQQHLGQMLFFDPRLSKSNQIACASCHDSELGWGDGRRTSFGHDRQRGGRNAMTVLNAAYFSQSFWDGRAQGIEDQALQPITNPIEMAESLDSVVAKLQGIEGYKAAFASAFDDPAITTERMAQAIAAFEKTVVSRPSRFDAFVQGRYTALSDRQIEGLHLFRTKAGCMNCHSGPLFSDDKRHNIGLTYYGRKYEDLGRFQVTGKEEDKGKFRTPSLRDLVFTGPYMHNGLFSRLRGVLNMYNHGLTYGQKLKPGEPELSPLIKPLNMTRDEIVALEDFLRSLSNTPIRMEPPMLPQ
jgi:cytochrome c peroxidase